MSQTDTLEAVMPRAAINLWSHPHEVEELRRMLLPGENLLFLTNAKLLRRVGLSRRWLVALTQHRLICMRGHKAMNRRLVEVPVESIAGAYVKRDMWAKEVRVDTLNGSIRLGKIPESSQHELINLVISLRRSSAVPATDRVKLPDAGTSMPAPAQAPALSAGAPSFSVAPQSSAVAQAAHRRMEDLELTVEKLNSDVARLQDQIDFLERVLEKRHAGIE